MRLVLCIFISLISLVYSSAQLENVFVEKYYISDSKDATNTTGGILQEGSVTYRIYIDLAKGSKLLKVYGEPNRPIRFASTSTFYNHLDDGVSTSYTINKNRLKENLIALDSWITLGQVTRPNAGSALFGVPKQDDSDGSIIGGLNNDGGSEEIAGGLMTHNDPTVGTPIVETDGLLPSSVLPSNWFAAGLIDSQTGEDMSVFASTSTPIFESEEFLIQNNGVSGVDENKNFILIAQLTTTGEIDFKINMEILDLDGTRIKYVHKDTLVQSGEVYSPLLSYPALCGCTDPEYIEYSTNFACSDISKCKTLIKYGCLDSLACNYDPTANLNINSLCCYIGFCNDYDIAVICPDLPLRTKSEEEFLIVEPNPTMDMIRLKHNISVTSKIFIEIYNNSLQKVMSLPLTNLNEETFDVSNLSSGYYHIVVKGNEQIVRNKFVKI